LIFGAPTHVKSAISAANSNGKTMRFIAKKGSQTTDERRWTQIREPQRIAKSAENLGLAFSLYYNA
jgi:hypothetical protein